MTKRSHVKLRLNRALELEQLLLAIEPAGVADQRPVRADHAVAREHDRDRVAVHDDPNGAGGLRAMGLGGEGSIGRELAVGNLGEKLQHLAVELARHSQIERELELRARALEVLAQLAARRIDRLCCAEDAKAERLREFLRRMLGVRVVRDSAQAPIGRCYEQRPDRRVGEVVRDVEQPRRGRGLTEALVERGGDGNCILLLSLRTPDEAA